MGTGADRLRVSRAAGGQLERGGGPRESRRAGAAALAPLGRCPRLGHCGFASYDCVTHTSDILLDHLLLHFDIRMSNFDLTFVYGFVQKMKRVDGKDVLFEKASLGSRRGQSQRSPARISRVTHRDTRRQKHAPQKRTGCVGNGYDQKHYITKQQTRRHIIKQQHVGNKL